MALNTFGWTPAEVTTDSAGNVIAGVTLTVFTDVTKANQVTGLFDKDGVTALPNDVVVSDNKGRFGFKASDAYSLLYVYDGSTADPWPIAAHEALDQGMASHAQAVADARAAADSAAASAALVGAPADSAIATAVNGAGTQTRAALESSYAVMVKKPTGVAATDTANIQAAITAALAAGGGRVRLQGGDYLTNAALTVGDNLVIEGAGRERTRIVNAVSDLFSWAASATTIRDLALVSENGGGHVFVQSGLVRRCTFSNLHIDQANDAKSIYSAIADTGNYLFNRWAHVTAYHTQTATVPTFHFKVSSSNGAINANTWEDMDPTRSGTYAFHFESARQGNYIYDNVLRDIRFEAPHGGAVKLLGSNRTTLDNVTIYDCTASVKDMIYVGRGTHATVPAANKNLVVRGFLLATPLQNGTKALVFQSQVAGQAAYVEDTYLESCGAHNSNMDVDFGDTDKAVLVNCRVNRFNGDRVMQIGGGTYRLAPGKFLTGKAGASDGLAADSAGNVQASAAADLGLGAQQLLNSELDTDIRQWSDASVLLSYTTDKARIYNTTGAFQNITALSAAALSTSQTYKIVVKLATITAFPTPSTAVRFFVGGSTYTPLAQTTTEQVFYSTLGSTGGLLLRVNTGVDVELDYIRVYPVTATPATIHGALSHRGASAGFYGTAPVARPVLSYSRTGESVQEAALRGALSALGLVTDSTTA